MPEVSYWHKKAQLRDRARAPQEPGVQRGWSLDLVCTTGRPLVLEIQRKDDELLGIQFRPLQSATPPRCPTR